MEDQQPDSGDLTNAVSPAQPAGDAEATEAKASRRRHRMPLRSELAASREATAHVAVDQAETDESSDPTAAEAAEAQPTTRRRRWSLFGRRPKSPEPEVVSAAENEADAAGARSKPAARVPVGKASRTAKTNTEPESTADDEPVTVNAEAESVPPEELILVPHRPAGKRLTIAASVAAAVFVGAAALGGSMLQPYLADRALVHTKLDIAKTAASAITALWTYTPDNMDKLPDRAAGYLAGDFANEYRKYIDAIVAPNKQAQVTNTTQVMGTAVESVTPTEATALVYTNSVATSPGSKNIPSLRYLSYRLTMQRHDAKWLITRMSTVTSFDLTPQL
ncbi:MAG: mammalian cell entry protein [Mycobacterium sp.]